MRLDIAWVCLTFAMKAIPVHRFRGLEVLEPAESPHPAPRPGQVLLRSTGKLVLDTRR
jgi:hypothetical protein